MRNATNLLAKGAFMALACAFVLAAAVTPVQAAETTTMLRLYNPNSGEHFYTASADEKDDLVEEGWDYEGSGWTAPASSNTPVYRLYNPNAGDHHYTMSATERDSLVEEGWNDEGIGWYSDDDESVPLYRLYNPNAESGSHHYTTSSTEAQNLVNEGWKSEGVAWYAVNAENPGNKIPAVDIVVRTPIMGTSQTTVEQMAAYYNAYCAQNGWEYPAEALAEGGAATIEEFCQQLFEEAEAEGVRAEVVFCQAMHETKWLQFGGDVKVEQFNFAGIGATGGGEPGNSFESVRIGLRAQVQHLKGYASTDDLNQECVDPRFKYLASKRGCAPSVEELGGKWATGSGYGEAIVKYMNQLATY